MAKLPADPDALDELVDWLTDLQALQSCLYTYRHHHPRDTELRNEFSLAKRLRGHMQSRLADYRAREALVEDELGRHWYKGRVARPEQCMRCPNSAESDVHRKCHQCGSPHHGAHSHDEANRAAAI